MFVKNVLLFSSRNKTTMQGRALAKLAAWAISLMYIGPKLAAWALRLEVGAIGEVTIAIGCEDREESSW
jgi:hypothetical protein